VPQATAVLTRTIGSGKDYASFTLAEADVTNIGTSADLLNENERIVFEADAGTYAESVTFQSTLTTDATRQVTYKPASGAEHGGDFSAGVILSGLQKGFGFYQHMIGLHLSCTGGSYTTVTWGGSGWVFDACLTTVPASSAVPIVFGGDSSGTNAKSYVRNCVARMSPGTTADTLAIGAFSYQGPIDLEIHNCTAIGTPNNQAWQLVNFGGAIGVKFVNCLHLGDKTYAQSGAATVTGSNNFGSSTGPFPVALQGTPATITASQSADPGAGDYALYVGKNGALLDSPNNDVIGQGVGPAANSDVPLYDIIGNFRAGDTANPGAFEIPQATYTWKKTIGPVGRDYATFTLAEADVTNIPTSTDLVNENEAIVFEADAGTYNETVFYTSTLTTDATRNVTYKPAAGSEHGGDPAAGVILGTGANTQDVRDDYTVLSGLHLNGQHVPSGDGAKVSGCILTRTSGNCASTAAPNNTVRIVYENSVFRPAGTSFGFQAYGQYGSATVGFYNCTFSFQAGATSARGLQSYVVSPYENDFDIVNCIAFVGGAVYTQSGAGTHTIAGSNNFGSSSGPFPVALQGSPYPITATTDTDPGPGDWAIYDAATGALINDSDNDVLAGGVGPSANSDVPETDIVGNLRSGSTADPGAFEISSIPAPLPGLSSDMQQTYQAEAAYTLALTPSGVTNVTHQLGPGPTDYLRVNPSTESREVKFPDGVQAVRVVATANSAPCSVTVVLSDGAGGEVESDIGYVGGAALSADYTHLWNLSALQSDGSYPKLKFTREGTWTVSQDIYVWWHTS
jgi:hypothetical protein